MLTILDTNVAVQTMSEIFSVSYVNFLLLGLTELLINSSSRADIHPNTMTLNTGKSGVSNLHPEP